MVNIRNYKYLTKEEVEYYRSMTVDEIESVKSTLNRSTYHLNVKTNDFKLNEPFHVENGDWDGVVYKEEAKYYMDIFVDIGEGYIDKKDITEAFEQGLPSKLDIYYIIDDNKISEFYKIYNDKTTYLYSADENCDHEIESGDNYSGIKCIHCNGWYCA